MTDINEPLLLLLLLWRLLLFLCRRSGCVGFQYNMVDSAAAPPDILSGSFSEKLIYLPVSYQANDMPLEVQPCLCSAAGSPDPACCKDELLMPPPSEADGFDSFGSAMPGLRRNRNATWLCSFNSNKKFEPISFSGL